MATLRIVTRPKPDRFGEVPIVVRVEHERRTLYVPTGYRIDPAYWNKRTEHVRRNHPGHAQLAPFLDATRLKLASLTSELPAELSADGLAERVKECLRGSEKESNRNPEVPDVFRFADSVTAEYERRGKIATYRSYKAQMDKFKRFVGGGKLPFDQVTVKLVEDYETWLLSKAENNRNTATKALNVLRTILRRAVRDGLMSREGFPFDYIKLKNEDVLKEWLTLPQIRAIEGLQYEEGSLIWNVRNWWLLAFYSGGTRFSDVATMRGRHLRSEGEDIRIHYKMQKTDGISGTLLLPPARRILGYYGDSWQPDELVLPILQGRDLSTPKALHNAIGSANALANKYLKKIDADAQLYVGLRFHLSRDSLAQYLLESGFSLYEIKDILGHSSVVQTQRYIKGFGQRHLDQKLRSLSF